MRLKNYKIISQGNGNDYFKDSEKYLHFPCATIAVCMAVFFPRSQVALGNALVGGNSVAFRRWGQRRLPTELILRQAQDDRSVKTKFY